MSLFQGVGIDCIQRCPHFRGLVPLIPDPLLSLDKCKVREQSNAQDLDHYYVTNTTTKFKPLGVHRHEHGIAQFSEKYQKSQ